MYRARIHHGGLWAAAALALACGGDDVGSTQGPGISASASISASGNSHGSDSEGSSGPTASSTTDDGGIKLDVGGVPDGGIVEGPCRKVDVILAVDNSGTMQEEIDALQGPVFNALPTQLLAVGNGLDDFHLAVIDGCPKPAHYHNWGKDGACNFSSGKNYMVSTSPNLDAEFTCVTNLTNAGYNATLDECVDMGELMDDDEQPALTAATSVGPMAIAAANSGFLRDDAVLWVIAITDEDEEGFGPDAQGIAQMLIDAKGDINDIVFLGVGGKSSCNGPYGSAQNAGLLQSITAVFEQADRGLFWDLCQGDLPQAFVDTIPKVDLACDNFIPG